MEKRDWREAKIPQWAKDSIDAELEAWEITAALSWPSERKPEPMPFWWGDYDELTGEPVEGRYWSSSGYSVYFGMKSPTWVDIRKSPKNAGTWKNWQFRSSEATDWGTNVRRGLLYQSEADAWLAGHWSACEKFASILREFRRRGR